MKSITFKVGPLRNSIGRLFSGGLCPLNVMGRNWSIVPRFSGQQEEKYSDEFDASPAAAGKVLLRALRKVLERQKIHDQLH